MKNFLNLKWLYSIAAVVLLGFLVASCSSDDDDNVKSQKARIELKGNFSGTLLVVHTFSTSNGGESDTTETKTLPWTKEYNYAGQIAMGAAANSITKGKQGETIELNLIVNGEVKATARAAADANGEIKTQTITYTQN